MKSKWLWILLLMLLWGEAAASTLSLSSKNILFFVDDSSGSFYIRDPEPENKRLRYLLFNDNPPSSYITLTLNDKPYRMNSADFDKTEYIRVIDEVVQSTYYKDDVQFTVRMYITNSSARNKKDAVLLLITVVNRGEKRVKVGGRFLLDTTYDEQKGKPRLYLDSTEAVIRERLIQKAMVPDFIFSGEYSGDARNFGPGLYIFPQVNSLSPTSIILGNWKKLDDAEMDYKVRPKDAFRASQYGSKDAAVAIFFSEIPVKPSEIVTYGIMLSVNQTTGDEMSDVTAVDSLKKNPVTRIDIIPEQQNNHLTSNNVPAMTYQIITNKIIQPQVQPQTYTPTIIYVTNTVFVPQTNTHAPVIMTNTGISTEEYEKLLQSQIQLMEKMNNIMLQISSISNQSPSVPRVITNVVSTAKDMVPKQELEKLRDAHEKQMQEVEDRYEALLEQQKQELEKAISEYEIQLKDSTVKKNKVEAVSQLDLAIKEMDQKIKVIEELEKLRLDFKTMPQEKLDELYEMLESLEKKLVKIQYK